MCAPDSLCHFLQITTASHFLLFKSPASHLGNSNLNSQKEGILGNTVLSFSEATSEDDGETAEFTTNIPEQ